MATQTTNATKKEFTLKQVFAMWKRASKDGKTYFTGKDETGKELRGFFNTKKQNPKEPDVRIYHLTEGKDLEKEPFVSLWCNVTKNGKKYLSGKIDGKKVIGFINDKSTDENKMPYFSVYWSDDKTPTVYKSETKKKDETNPF